MFDFLRKNKEYVSCEWLEYGIHFSPLGIEHCCMYIPKNMDYTPISLLKNGKYDVKDFFNKKIKTIKSHKKGILDNRCSGCFNLKKDKWVSSKKLSYMVLNLNYACNSDCCYCYTHRNKKLYNKSVDVPVLYFVEDAIKKDLLDINCEIHLGGGEPLLNKEFDDILNLLVENNFKNIKIYSSGIQYSSSVENAIKNNACKIYISVDSGTCEMYKTIKNTDKFDSVWDNIAKYASYQNVEINNAVCVKYILLPGLNDNKEEIDKFLYKVKESNSRTIVSDIERTWYKENSDNKNLLEPLIKLGKYMELFAKDNGISYIYFPSFMYAMRDNQDIYEAIEEDGV